VKSSLDLSSKFGDEFDFEITAYPSKSGGNIHLVVKPKGSGSVSVVNPDAMNQMVLDDPKYRPESARKEDGKEDDKKEDDKAAKKKDGKKKK
jgi:hypothetical protein